MITTSQVQLSTIVRSGLMPGVYVEYMGSCLSRVCLLHVKYRESNNQKKYTLKSRGLTLIHDPSRGPLQAGLWAKAEYYQLCIPLNKI